MSAVLPVELVFLHPAGSRMEPYTTSEVIAEGTGIARRKIRDAIRKYQSDLESFGVLASYQAETTANKEGGRKALVYRLNEQQAAFLLTLLKNTPAVVTFKKELVRQFYAMRDFIQERRSSIWQDTRALGKEIRRMETDAIKALVDYAEAQGSRHAVRYYQSISRLADRTAGVTERDKARTTELSALLMVERIVAQEIRAGIEAGEPYRAIYATVREKLYGLSSLLAPVSGGKEG